MLLDNAFKYQPNWQTLEKKSFMLTMYDMLKQYNTNFHSDFRAMIDANGDELRTKQYQSRITETLKLK